MTKIDIQIFCPNCLTGGVTINTPCKKNCDTMKCLICLSTFFYKNGKIYKGHDNNCYKKMLPI
jgi:hypothetical protein